MEIFDGEREDLLFYEELGREQELKTALDESLRLLDMRKGVDEQEISEELDRTQHFLAALARIQMNMADMEGNSAMTLRINQLQALRDFISFLKNDGEGGKLGYFHQPTGAGKTVLMGLLLYLAADQGLVLVPNKNLLSQTKDEYMEILGISEKEIGLVGGGYAEFGRKYTISTYGSLKKVIENGGADIDMIILDEVHAGLGDVTQDQLAEMDDQEMSVEEMEEMIGEFAPRSAIKLGFTATPNLRNKRVRDYYPVLISRVYMADLVEAGILVPFRVIHVEGEITAEEYGVKDFTLDQEREVLEREDIYSKLIEKFLETDQSLDFSLLPLACCSDVSECERFLDVAAGYGLSGTVIVGGNEDEDLRQAENDLEAGKINFIVTVRKLEAGWNWKKLNAVIMARATKSPVKLIQPAGRASRSLAGKHAAYVFETDWKVSGAADLSGKLGAEENNPGVDSSSSSGSRASNRTLSRRPLSLMSALQISGERDVHKIGSGLNGEPMDFIQEYYADESGVFVANLEGKEVEAVVLSAYAKTNGLFYATLRDAVENAGLNPIRNVVGWSGPHLMPVYLRQEVDALLPRQINEDGTGIAVIDGKEVEVVNTSLYSKTVGIKRFNLGKLVQEAGVEKIPGVMFLNQGGKRISVYLKSEIDDLLPKKLDDNGVIVLKIDGKEVECVGLSRYGERVLEIKSDTVKARVDEAGVVPVPGVKVYGGRLPVDVYVKSEVDKVAKPMKVDENGVIQLPGTFEAVNLGNYLPSRGVDRRSFKAVESQLGVELPQELTGVRVYNSSGRTTVPLVKKSEVDELLDRIFDEKGEARVQVNGELIEVVQLDMKRKIVGMGKKAMLSKLEEAGVQPFTEILFIKGRKVASDVYLKVEFDRVLGG